MKSNLKKYWLYYAVMVCCVMGIIGNANSDNNAMRWAIVALLWVINCFLKQITINRMS